MASKALKEDPVLQRLDTIIRLQARIAVGHLDTQKEKVIFLSSAGLSPKDIGDILGVSANSVSVTLFGVRKASKGPKSNQKPASKTSS
jgi:DNA-binding CsgD family transcriptional regulator